MIIEIVIALIGVILGNISGYFISIVANRKVYKETIEKASKDLKKDFRAVNWQLLWNIFSDDKKESYIRQVLKKVYCDKEIELKTLAEVLPCTTNIFTFLSEAYTNYINEYVENGPVQYQRCFWGDHSFCENRYPEVYRSWLNNCPEEDGCSAWETIEKDLNDFRLIQREIIKQMYDGNLF